MSGSSDKLTKIVANARKLAPTGIPLAIALHNYVRDEIKFGFTPYFDAASPDVTLKLGVGHCNPQAWLMVELLRAAGFQARFRPSTISNDILKGVASTPARISHVFTEVKIDDSWLRIDSYIADPPFRDAAVRKLSAAKKTCGYGCHVSATGNWDGTKDAFSQIAESNMIIELHDPVEDIGAFYQSDDYAHRFGPLSFNLMFAPGRLAIPLAMAALNGPVNRLRNAVPV